MVDQIVMPWGEMLETDPVTQRPADFPVTANVNLVDQDSGGNEAPCG